jgi:hypothetical protein
MDHTSDVAAPPAYYYYAYYTLCVYCSVSYTLQGTIHSAYYTRACTYTLCVLYTMRTIHQAKAYTPAVYYTLCVKGARKRTKTPNFLVTVGACTG